MGSYMQMLTNRAKAAASEAAKLGTSDKNRGLLAVAEELAAHQEMILEENAKDVEAAKEKGGEETIARVVKDSFEQKRYGGVSQKLAAQIEQLTGYETRATILGHIQRGGEPTTSDT